MRPRLGQLAPLVLLLACNGGLHDKLYPTGSATLVRVDHGDAVVSVNTTEGSISRLDLESGAVEELVVGAEPSRVAPFGNRLLVSLRGESAVAVIDVSGDKMRLEKRIRTGSEPFGVVADEAGRHAYVAVSQGHEVLEIDRDLAITRRFPVSGEPRWLALHPSERALFVVGARGARLTRIDLDTGESEDVDSPEVTRPTDTGGVVLDHRFTGDPAITPDGGDLVIPGVHVDTTTPVDTPTGDRPASDGYGASGLTIGRINPTLSVFPLDRHGGPDQDRKPRVVFLGTFAGRQGEIVRSYPTSATADPEGGQVLVTMEASNAVIAVDLRGFQGQGDSPGASSPGFFGEGTVSVDVDRPDTGFGGGPSFFDAMPSQGGMFELPLVATTTAAAGPDGAVFVDRDRAYVHQFLDRTVSQLPYEAVEADLNDAAREGFAFGAPHGTTFGTTVTASTLEADVDLGRRLFFSARDERMAGFGAGVSCSTCHFGGRDDGLTWTFDFGPRQTPSLAGKVSETFPVTWTDAVDSVATEAQLTSQLRMGGRGISNLEAQAIQAFVDASRPVVIDDRLDEDAVARGRVLFERADVGCAECHSGARFTDNQSHELFGLQAVNTPPLTGIAATAPYLHDGSASSLEAVLVLSSAGRMGDTSMLTADQLADLAEYLRSL